MAWTGAELRAIAEGEAAADNSGAMPEALAEPERAAWRQGYARGWNGLGQPRQVDIPEHTVERDAWSQGWQAGWAVCKAAGRGYTQRLHETLWERVLKIESFDASRWSIPESDAYHDGAAAAWVGREGFPAARYRGRLRELAMHWIAGWQDAYRELVEGDPAAARRVAELRRLADLEEEAAARGATDGRPRSGAERQRAYRERRATAWVTMPAEAHAGFREASAREGTSLDRTLRPVLEAALRLLKGWDENMGALEAEARRGEPSSAEAGGVPAAVADAAAPRETEPAAPPALGAKEAACPKRIPCGPAMSPPRWPGRKESRPSCPAPPLTGLLRLGHDARAPLVLQPVALATVRQRGTLETNRGAEQRPPRHRHAAKLG
jgi:hypothetical protein